MPVNLPTKASDYLAHTVNAWSVQVVVASQILMGLYRRLGDEKQASRAIQAGASADERCQRLNLHAQIHEQRAQFRTEYPDETEAESAAWRLLVEGQAGLSAFHALVDHNHFHAEGIRSKRHNTYRGFQVALRGFRTAFPEEMTAPWIQQTIHQAADLCARTIVFDVDEPSEAHREGMYNDLYESFLKALQEAL